MPPSGGTTEPLRYRSITPRSKNPVLVYTFRDISPMDPLSPQLKYLITFLLLFNEIKIHFNWCIHIHEEHNLGWNKNTLPSAKGEGNIANKTKFHVNLKNLFSIAKIKYEKMRNLAAR